MDFEPIDHTMEVEVMALIDSVMRRSMRDAMELGTKLHAIHLQCTFDNMKADCAAWQARHPERALEDFQPPHFDRARQILAHLGFEW